MGVRRFRFKHEFNGVIRTEVIVVVSGGAILRMQLLAEKGIRPGLQLIVCMGKSGTCPAFPRPFQTTARNQIHDALTTLALVGCHILCRDLSFVASCRHGCTAGAVVRVRATTRRCNPAITRFPYARRNTHNTDIPR